MNLKIDGHKTDEIVSSHWLGITGILMSAAGLPVCLTRPPKLVLHPPAVSKSDIKPVPGLGHCCRKTTKKQARKGKEHRQFNANYNYLQKWIYIYISKHN